MCQKTLKASPVDLGNYTSASWKYDVPKIRKADLFPLILWVFIYNPVKSHRLKGVAPINLFFFKIGSLHQRRRELLVSKCLRSVNEQI